jgi:hypothetical protein
MNQDKGLNMLVDATNKIYNRSNARVSDGKGLHQKNQAFWKETMFRVSIGIHPSIPKVLVVACLNKSKSTTKFTEDNNFVIFVNFRHLVRG